MQDWLATFSSALADGFPDLPGDPAPSSELADDLLSLARIVAEGTGQKTNAPLTCYVVGYLAGSMARAGEPSESAVERAAEIAGRLLSAQD